MAKQKTKIDKVIEHIKRASGYRRREHFATGGTVEQWRGIHQVVPNKKKEQSRKACRKVKPTEIE